MKNFQPQTNRLWPSLFLAGWIFAFGVAPCAAEIQGYPASVLATDPREVALLPRYCIYAQSFRGTVPGGSNQAEIRRWTSVMGPTFEHMHHYCWGLMKNNRANVLARTQQDRLFYLGDAIGEFDYVIQRAPPDFVLLPEILTKKGENLLRLGKTREAVRELIRAIELKPDYWPPYEALSEHYRAAGDIAKAREMLEQGLSFSPDSKTLKRRLAELGVPANKPKSSP